MRHHQNHKIQMHNVKFPSFDGNSDLNVYLLGWEAKIENKFNV